MPALFLGFLGWGGLFTGFCLGSGGSCSEVDAPLRRGLSLLSFSSFTVAMAMRIGAFIYLPFCSPDTPSRIHGLLGSKGRNGTLGCTSRMFRDWHLGGAVRPPCDVGADG